MAEKVSRRDFIRRSGVTAASAGMALSVSPLSASPTSARPQGANDRVRVGFVGMGRMGRSNLRDFLKQPDVEAFDSVGTVAWNHGRVAGDGYRVI